jgi:dienelactone hydrolase
MNKIATNGWIKGIGGATLGVLAGITGAALGLSFAADKPVQAQAFTGPPIEMTSTTVGAASHAYAVDTRMAQIIFCKANAADARPACTAVPIPGTAQR